MKLTTEQIHDLEVLINDAGLPTQSYSGRSMYGKECLAFTCEGSVFEAFADIVQESDEEQLDLVIAALRHTRTDSLGLDTIVYFPNAPYAEKAETESGECDCEGPGETYPNGLRCPMHSREAVA